jgi:tetratricopeptide (TPR) repeat protein
MRCFLAATIFIFILTYYAGAYDIEDASFNLAEKLIARQKYSEALEELNKFTDRFPGSVYYNNAVIDKARLYFALKEYEKSVDCYTVLENNSRNEFDRRTALFGKGEDYYRLKLWSLAAESFKYFAFQYKNSPVRHAALYYGGKSYEFLKRIPEAEVFFECLVSFYPGSPYYAEAKKELMNLKCTNTAEATNTVELTNTLSPIPLTNFITNITTNTILVGSNQAADTNEALIMRLSEENKRKQEEIQRYMELIELKAKLLDLKEKAINEKQDILYETNYISNTGPTNGTNR